MPAARPGTLKPLGSPCCDELLMHGVGAWGRRRHRKLQKKTLDEDCCGRVLEIDSTPWCGRVLLLRIASQTRGSLRTSSRTFFFKSILSQQTRFSCEVQGQRVSYVEPESSSANGTGPTSLFFSFDSGPATVGKGGHKHDASQCSVLDTVLQWFNGSEACSSMHIRLLWGFFVEGDPCRQ